MSGLIGRPAITVADQKLAALRSAQALEACLDFPTVDSASHGFQPALDRQHSLETGIAPALKELAGTTQQLSGYCGVCQQPTEFSFSPSNDGQVNWREQLHCQHCQLISRWRGSMELAKRLLADYPHSPKIYLTEQLTPVFRWASSQWPDTVGSEFVDANLQPGAEVSHRLHAVRHEDVTQLSFQDNSLTHVMSFDVLEHVPAYQASLGEFFRVLQPGGALLLSVPFSVNHGETVVRAKMLADGNIEHLLEPEYHGDPVNAEGILCFYHFGWSLLEDMRSAGFSRVHAHPFWDPNRGYLGVGQILLTGHKG